jgi:PHP family Zn ribbon phosphoesterase
MYVQDDAIGSATAQSETEVGHQPFLGIYFVQCNVYGRLYRNPEATAYEGRCPRCGAFHFVRIGHGGTNQRLFKGYCRS